MYTNISGQDLESSRTAAPEETTKGQSAERRGRSAEDDTGRRPQETNSGGRAGSEHASSSPPSCRDKADASLASEAGGDFSLAGESSVEIGDVQTSELMTITGGPQIEERKNLAG
jgi:hypothetical protein